MNRDTLQTFTVWVILLAVAGGFYRLVLYGNVDALGAFAKLAMLVFALVWLAITAWVFVDAGHYRMNRFVWALVVLFFSFVGLIFYIVRRASVMSGRHRPRARTKRRVRRYDEDYDEDDDRYRYRRRRR